jgi:hypothetical protein
VGSASGGGMKNCCMVGEHKHIATLFIKQLYKNGKLSFKFLPVA